MDINNGILELWESAKPKWNKDWQELVVFGTQTTKFTDDEV